LLTIQEMEACLEALFEERLAESLIKLCLPTFNVDNVDNWIYECENFFHLDNTSNDIQLVIIHLEGSVLE